MRGFDRLSRVTHGHNAHALAEIPVATLAHAHGLLVAKGYLTCHLLQLVFPDLKDDPVSGQAFSVQLEGAYVGTLHGMDTVQYLGVCEIAVKGEVAGNAP